MTSPSVKQRSPGPAAAASPAGRAVSPFDALLHACQDAVLLVDFAGNILRANAAAYEILGATLDQPAKLNQVRRLFAPHDIRADTLLERLRHEGHSSGWLTVLSPIGEPEDAYVTVTAYEDGGTAGALVIIRPRRTAEGPHTCSQNAQDLPARAHAGRADAAAADLSRFAPSLAHDLLSPINTLGGFARALQRHLGDDASERSLHYVQRILAAVAQLEDHVQALLSLARVSDAPLSRSEVDLTASARAVLQELQLRELNRLLLATVEEGMRAEGDARLLKIVLENLLGNAWKFSAKKAESVISIGTERASDGTLVYRISDNGDGFDMAYAGKLFQDFQRLHSQAEFPGTGVGLANVHRIVTRHGGKVWAESTRGGGATFYFTLGADSSARQPLGADAGRPTNVPVTAEAPA